MPELPDHQEEIMRVKVVLGGEAVNIPKTDIGLGVAFIRVWVDGNGFTSASNDLGSLGYILLETPDVEVGEVDAERQRLFTNLHASVVHWTIKPNIFFRDGGIANVTMSVPVQQEGGIVEKTIQFVATDCRGVAVVSNALDFSCEMLQEEKKLAELESEQIVPDDVIVAAADEAPSVEADEATA
jgi:hypothetical protein